MSVSSKPALHTPTSFRGDSKQPKVNGVAASSSAAVALNMIWQLLVVVILPIVGGHVLDEKLHTSPVFMCVGMVIAVAAMIVVVRDAMRELADIMERSDRGKK